MNKNEIKSLKTDLADETDELIKESKSSNDGFETSEKKRSGFGIFTMNVKNSLGEKNTGRPIGRYVTVDVGKTWLYDRSTFDAACSVCAGVFSEFIKTGTRTLVVGLGNADIAADSVGKRAVSNIIVTRHIKNNSPEMFAKLGFAETSAIIPDVLGNTGIESAEIIKGVADDVKPELVVAIDSLSSRRLSRLATTVQICDTGILPGSGVGNGRAAVNKETLGVPVIAIGIPTVVSAATLVTDIMLETGMESNDDPCSRQAVEKIKNVLSPSEFDYYVTPKESEKIIRSSAKVVGYALNKAIHGNMEFSEMQDFLSL